MLGEGCLMAPPSTASLSKASWRGCDHLFDQGVQRGSWSHKVTLGARIRTHDLEVAASFSTSSSLFLPHLPASLSVKRQHRPVDQPGVLKAGVSQSTQSGPPALLRRSPNPQPKD